MNAYWAHMHVGATIQFVGNSWNDGGFAVDANGNPTHDPNRNTVADYTVAPLTGPDADDLTDFRMGEIFDAYAGEAKADRSEFAGWLRGQGFESDAVRRIVGHNLEMLTERCAYCSRDVAFRGQAHDEGSPVPAEDDDAAWQERAAEHDDDCEWVATRAHRIEPSDAD